MESAIFTLQRYASDEGWSNCLVGGPWPRRVALLVDVPASPGGAFVAEVVLPTFLKGAGGDMKNGAVLSGDTVHWTGSITAARLGANRRLRLAVDSAVGGSLRVYPGAAYSAVVAEAAEFLEGHP